MIVSKRIPHTQKEILTTALFEVGLLNAPVALKKACKEHLEELIKYIDYDITNAEQR